MKYLLDNQSLTGTYDVATTLRPERAVRVLDDADVGSVIDMITYLCQVWGGNSVSVIPLDAGRVPSPYMPSLETGQYDLIEPRRHGTYLETTDLALPKSITLEHAWDSSAIAVVAHETRDRLPVLDVVELEDADPWKPIYAATLGLLPERPDPELSEFVGMLNDLAFDDVIEVRRGSIEGSLDDLLTRLAERSTYTPRRFAGIYLASGMMPDTSFFGESPLVPGPRHERRVAGPNVVVVVSPGSVADVALLWNMRAAHGDTRQVPIGLPVGEVTRESLDRIQQPGVIASFGFAGGPARLVSASLPMDELERLAALRPPMQAVSYEQLLTFGPPAARHRNQVVLFTDGVAHLEAMTESDRDVLSVCNSIMRKPQLYVDVRVQDRPLPADVSMRGSTWGPSYRGGHAQVRADLDKLTSVSVAWPSTWTMLSAVARTRQLEVAVSSPGRAALTLIESLGSVDAIRWLMHPGLVELLYRLGERTGMSWQKKQLNAVRERLSAEGRDTAALDDAEKALQQPNQVVTPPGEGRDVPFEAFRKALGDETAATRWVQWAERHHLIVRGASISCPDCGAEAWQPMASIPPPIGCPGCGRSITEPYGPRHLPFTYRLGEPVRRVLETDSLGHVLALHWLVAVFGKRGLVGAHPGVDFEQVVNGVEKRVGEADVLLLFADGTLVPVEVKRTGAGFDPQTVGMLDKLSDALNAPFDVAAMSQPARDCPDLPDRVPEPPHRRRFHLTDDQTYDPDPMWGLGANPFEWQPRTPEQDEERAKKFVDYLIQRDPDERWDQVQYTLLADE